MSLKFVQTKLQTTITCSKKSGKGYKEQKEAYLDVQFPRTKLKTLVKTRFANYVITFQKTLEYMKAINICYKWQTTHQAVVIVHGITQLCMEFSLLFDVLC